jgi:hypothetical protein
MNIIGLIKYGRMRWAGHVARMGKKRNAYRDWLGNLKGKGLIEGKSIDLKMFK